MASINNQVIENDHSASVLTPYICEYLGDVEVVTLLVSKAATGDSLRAVAEAIAGLQEKKNILVLGSVDFSHGQTPEECAKRDEKTKQIIEEGNITELRTLDGKNLDSPEVLSIFLFLEDQLGQELLLYDHRMDTFIENGERRAGSYFVYGIEQKKK